MRAPLRRGGMPPRAVSSGKTSVGTESLRRRQFRAPRRRRSLVAVLWRPLVTAMFLVGLPVAAGHWLLTSPRFVLSEVELKGAVRVPGEWVFQELAPLRGRHLLSLSLPEIERRLAEHPWIGGADMRKRLPDRLVVEIFERRPAALLRRDGELYYVDAGGEVIEAYDPGGAVDMVLLSGLTGSPGDIGPALAAAGRLGELDPELAAGLSEVEILGAGELRLHSAVLPYPLLVTAEGLDRQLRGFRRYQPEIARRYERLEAVDLRFHRQIVIQPAVMPPSREG